MHRRLFAPGTPPATGTLHVAGKRPGSEQAFALSQPRYSRSRQGVSYRVKRLDTGGGASGVGSAAQSSGTAAAFGAASLSIVGAPPVLGSTFGGHDCETGIENNTGWGLQAIGASKWDTDTWNPGIPAGVVLGFSQVLSWESDGGFLRGCSASAVWQLVRDPAEPNSPDPPAGTFALTTTYPWSDPATSSCGSSNPQFTCQQVLDTAGDAWWWINRR